MAQGFTKGIPISTDPTMSANSDLVVPSQSAIVAYINSVLPLGGVSAVNAAAPVQSSGGPTPTISMLPATVAQDGYLKAVDFSLFNNKQDAISLTTTGTTGLATFIANILNIPQYQGALTLTTLGITGAATLNPVTNVLNIPQYGGGGGGVSAGDAIAYAIALG